jgi:hypothetical protein
VSSISAERKPDRVTVTIEVDGKTARISVTHERALDLACDMLGLEGSWRGIIAGATRNAEKRKDISEDFVSNLAKAMRSMGGR